MPTYKQLRQTNDYWCAQICQKCGKLLQTSRHFFLNFDMNGSSVFYEYQNFSSVIFFCDLSIIASCETTLAIVIPTAPTISLGTECTTMSLTRDTRRICENSTRELSKLLQKVWNIIFPLIFVRISHDQVRAELQLAKRCRGGGESKSKVAEIQFPILLALEAELPWLHRCDKGVKCAVRLDQSGYTFAIANDDSCNFWFWPLPYSTRSISIIPQTISKRFSIERRE